MGNSMGYVHANGLATHFKQECRTAKCPSNIKSQQYAVGNEVVFFWYVCLFDHT